MDSQPAVKEATGQNGGLVGLHAGGSEILVTLKHELALRQNRGTV